jgi:hypothetical protein
MARTANPAIIIGLGGTGQWVLTYLKKNLIDTYGEVPKTVRLLAFDTTGEKTEAAVGADKRPGKERAQVANVSLDKDEFAYLGGNIRRFCEGIAGKLRDPQTGELITFPYIGSWLQGETYLQVYDDDAYEVSKGAGQRRPFGRMAVFYDLATSEPKILGKIKTAITEVIGANERQQPIEIYITCSLAGGTGSGMFIDITHIARKLAEQANVAFAVRGFIVLQNTFEPVIRFQNVMPNAFAAMRELDRFMLVFDRKYPIYYTEEHREPHAIYHSIHTSKLFDSCYLIDSIRSRSSLRGVDPRFGVFPSVAEFMTALLDPETGDTFAQHYKNVNNDLARAQQAVARLPTEAGTVFYSSLGTFTYILPVADIIERNTYRLVLELLHKRLLTIHETDGGSLKVSSEGNQESRYTPREEAAGFLAMNRSHTGMQNLRFNQQVASVLTSGRTKDLTYITDVADLGVTLLNWLLPVEQDEIIVQTTHDLQKTIEFSLLAEVPNSRVYRDGFHSAADRISHYVLGSREDLLGYEGAGGRKVPGDLQKELDTCATRNLERFRNLLAEKMTDLLNGVADDPLIARQGKLPYVQEWLGWLVQSYGEFATFMREVIKAWTLQNGMELAREAAATARQRMYDCRDATGLFDRIGGVAVKAQNAYLGAEDYLLGLERQEMLMHAVVDLAESLTATVQQARDQIDHWLGILVLGGPVGSGEIGVYRQLLEEQVQLKRRREEQAHIKVHAYLTDDKYEDELYGRYLGEDKWREILRRFHWTVTPREGEIQLDLSYGEVALVAQSAKNETATTLNARLLVEQMSPYFQGIQDETIASRMYDLKTAARVAEELLDNSGILISHQPEEQSRVRTSNYVCVDRVTYMRYFDQLAAELADTAPTTMENKVIGLANKHRCVIVSMEDILASRHTDPYRAAARAYFEYSGDRRLLHVFPAEVNASWYEGRLSRSPLSEPQRLFSPMVVSLLEDREMVRRFALAMFYRLVRVEEVGDGKNQYVLRLDRTGRRDYTSVIRLTGTDPSQPPTLLDAMATFVCPRIDWDTSRKQIWDVTPGASIGVEPERVDQTLQRRKESVLSGREAIVEEFEQWMMDKSDLLTPTGWLVLSGVLCRFVEENERILRHGEDTELTERVERLLSDNEDVYFEPYRDEVRRGIMSVLDRHRGKPISPGGNRALVRRLEQWIDDFIRPMHQSDQQDIRDLASVLHLTLWDEIMRLEQLKDDLLTPVIRQRASQRIRIVSFDWFREMIDWARMTDPASFENQAREWASKLFGPSELHVRPETAGEHPTYLCLFLDISAAHYRLSLPETIGLVFIRDNQITLNEIDDFKTWLIQRANIKNPTKAGGIAILFLPSPQDEIAALRSQVDSAINAPYAADLIVAGKQEITELANAPDPAAQLRTFLLKHMNPVHVSPFLITGPASGDIFFGRESELREITAHAETASYALLGGRKIGKTSILLRLDQLRLPIAGLLPLRFHCQVTGKHNPSREEFLSLVTKAWLPAIEDVEPPESFLELRNRLPGHKPIVFLIDEADKLIPADRQTGWRLFGELRALAQSPERRCQFVFAGERTLRDAIVDDSTCPLFNFANPLFLKGLAPNEVHELITQPMQALEIELADKNVMTRRIFELTAGHPNIVQRLGQRLVRLVAEKPKRCITLDDLSTVINDPDFQTKDFLNVFWERTTLLERVLTLVLARKEDHTFTMRVTQDILRTQLGLDPPASQIQAALWRLVDLRNVLKTSEGGGYVFAAKLLPEIIGHSATGEDLLVVNVEDYRKYGDIVPEAVQHGAMSDL